MSGATRSAPTVAVLCAPGTNRQRDMAFAFERAGAVPTCVAVDELPERTKVVEGAGLVAIAGGFSYADALGSGRVFADELCRRLGDLIHDKVSRGCPVLGICNGFQVLVRAGILPGSDPATGTEAASVAALAPNERGTFECRWVTLSAVSSRCVWTAGLGTIAAPVAHGEGRFTAAETTVDRLFAEERVALRYAGGAYPANPNGSVRDIAGICDASGLVLGMMPHPENNVLARQGFSGTTPALAGSGLALFVNGVRHARDS